MMACKFHFNFYFMSPFFRLCFFFLISSIWLKGNFNKEKIYLLYNSRIPQSKELAEYYANKRNIPISNLIGLPFKNQKSVSKLDYTRKFLIPLRREFNTLESPPQLLICFKGVPYKTRPSSKDFDIKKTDASSVDSELSCLFIYNYKKEGAISNPLFKKNPKKNFLPLYVGRIDAPTWQTCFRLIDDSIAIEKKGIQGNIYLDISHKYKLGDDWLKAILKQTKKEFPTIIDLKTSLFPESYPLGNPAFYYGWYSLHLDGAFLDESFRFAQGAIAIHIHSFSASHLHNSQFGWVAPFLEKGVCATLGNVYEPLLLFTCHLNIFHQSLREGKTLIESAYLSVPVLSWQQIVIGDPLYRPFALSPQFSKAQDWERKGLEKLRKKSFRSAKKCFYKAKSLYSKESDKLRQAFHIADIFVLENKKIKGISFLLKYAKNVPENGKVAKAIFIYINRLKFDE